MDETKNLMPEELLGLSDFVSDADFTDEVNDAENAELEGLARRFGVPWTRRHSIVAKKSRRSHIFSALRKTALRSSMTRDQRLLFAKLPKMDSETVKRIKTGSVKTRDLSFYIRKKIQGGTGIIKIFDDTIDRVEGVTNISKGKLAEHVNLLMNRMEINYGEGADVKAAEFEPMSPGNTPAGLINGEVEVLVGGASVMKVPVSDFVNPDRKYFGNGPANGVNFENPILIPERTDIQVNLILVGTVNGASADANIDIKFKGDGLSPVK